jgi:hypothetical protein
MGKWKLLEIASTIAVKTILSIKPLIIGKT